VQADNFKIADERALGLRGVRRFARHPLDALVGRKRGNRRAELSRPHEAVLISPSGQVVCERCHVVDGSLPRIRGLIGWHPPAASEGILISSPPLVRVAFARFMMDALFLDEELTIVAVAEKLRPWRFAWKRHAHSLLELPAGRCEQLGLRPGDKFAWGLI
jgi:uncharacterized membrane protein (UPF0127 family)